MNREECLLRIYIVRGIDLQAKDSNGKVNKSIIKTLKIIHSILNLTKQSLMLTLKWRLVKLN